MISKQIQALKSLTLNTGVEKVKLAEGEVQVVRFPQHKMFDNLLATGSFIEVKDAPPNYALPGTYKTIPVDGAPPQLVTPVLTTEQMQANAHQKLKEAQEKAKNDQLAASQASTRCKDCDIDLVLAGEENDGNAIIKSFVCPVCSMTKTVSEMFDANSLKEQEDRANVEENTPPAPLVNEKKDSKDTKQHKEKKSGRGRGRPKKNK